MELGETFLWNILITGTIQYILILDRAKDSLGIFSTFFPRGWQVSLLNKPFLTGSRFPTSQI